MKGITESHIVQIVPVKTAIYNFTEIYLSNDRRQEKENDMAVDIFCDSCKKKYHYERNYGNDYLFSNGAAISKQRSELDRKHSYDDKEKLVKNRAEKNSGYDDRYDCTKM